MKLARFVLLGGTLLGLAALQTPSVGAQQQSGHNHAVSGTQDIDPNSPLVRAVQEATRTFSTPQDAPGYERFLGCVSGGIYPGAMGVHFVNGALVDGTLDVDHPEALIYEMKNGAARLLGVHANTVRAWTDQGRLTCIRINERGDSTLEVTCPHCEGQFEVEVGGVGG